MAVFMVWMMFHVITKVIPDLIRHHASEMLSLRTTFEATLAKLEERFRQTEERRTEEIDTICTRLDALTQNLAALTRELSSKQDHRS
jgi:hypothetical protein